MAIIERSNCKIETLNRNGLGVGKSNNTNKIVELPYTLPGEIVAFERHLYRKQSNCVLIEKISTSEDRAPAPCEYFERCGGCLLQHFSEPIYNQFKHNLIMDALAAAKIQTNILPLVTIPAGKRRRINLQAVKKQSNNYTKDTSILGKKTSGEHPQAVDKIREGIQEPVFDTANIEVAKVYLGFHRFRSHQIINIDNCLIILPELSKLLEPLKALLNELLQDKQKAELFLNLASNGIDILVVTDTEISPSVAALELLSTWQEKYGVIRVSLRSQDLTTVIYESAKPYILFDNVAVNLAADSFLQASALSDQILSELVLKYANAAAKTTDNFQIVDLFCGRGTYTIPLSRHHIVKGFDSDEGAINDLTSAITTIDRNISVNQRNLFIKPLTKNELDNYQFAIINPPRAGAKEQSIQLAQSNIKTIIYVSCNPESFSKDAQILCSKGYRLVEVTPLDQFYWSPHLEVIGLFEKT